MKKSRSSDCQVTKAKTQTSQASKKSINYKEGIKAIQSKIQQINSARNSQPITVARNSIKLQKVSEEVRKSDMRINSSRNAPTNSIKLTEDEIKYLSQTLKKEIQSKRCKSTKRATKREQHMHN